MGIPTYVLINPHESTVTVFDAPNRTRHGHAFCDRIEAGGYTIDSGAFLPYEDA